MLRRYGIGLQELPLLSAPLARKTESRLSGEALTFGEDLMKEHADRRTALKQAASGKEEGVQKAASGAPGAVFPLRLSHV